MKCISKNKIVLIIIGIILLTPIIIKKLILESRIFTFIESETNWLSFWGSYIGSIISSLIAIFILYKQLDQNHAENETNRKLQLNNIKYQQARSWLKDMREACIANIYSYDTNDVIEILNTMQIDKYQAYLQIKKLFSNLAKTDTGVAFLGNNSTAFSKEFHTKRTEYFVRYKSLINDIKLLVASTINVDNNIYGDCLRYIENNGASKAFMEYIKNYSTSNQLNTVINLSIAAAKYIDNCPNYFEEVRTFTLEYISKEENNINNICKN
jgi:hypothetical protein